MASILTQDEVDALLLSFQEEEKTPAAQPAEGEADSPSGSPAITVYDFRRPSRVSRDQLRFLETLHEGYAFSLMGILSGYLRAMVEMQVESVEPQTYGEWTRGLPESTSLFPFAMEPLEGSGVIQVPLRLVLGIVDRLLGGRGAMESEERGLTRLESTLFARVVQDALTALGQTWSEITRFTPRPLGYERSPRGLHLLPDTETTVCVTLALKTPSLAGVLSLCYPFFSIEAVIPGARAPSAQLGIQPKRIPQGPAWMLAGIRGGQIPLTVTLGTGSLRLGEFVRLQPGDVVRLDTRIGDPATVNLGGEAKFVGWPGRVGRKLAVQIAGRTSPAQGGEADGAECSQSARGAELPGGGTVVGTDSR